MVLALGGVLRRFVREVELLRAAFVRQLPLLTGRGLWLEAEPIAIQSYAIIRLHDAWARYSRSLVLSSAYPCRTLTGVPISRSPLLPSGGSALDTLRSTYPPKRQKKALWEPRWFDSTEAITAAQQLQINNFPNVSAGLGLVGHGPEELRACRNFLAHRSHYSNSELDAVRIRLTLPMSYAAEELAAATVTGGATLFDDWCLDLLQRAETAAQ